MAQTARASEVDFIRIFFIDPVEEEIARRWSSRLGRLIGPRIEDLRPDTTLAQMLRWGLASRLDSMDFLFVFEPELRMELTGFLADCESATFRDMVRHYAARFQSRA
jgi:hypothetical protein